MNESNLYNTLKKNWGGYIRRIEPCGAINDGFPDTHLVNEKKADIFIELKYLDKEFKSKKLPIRQSQFLWFLTYPGKNAYLLFQVGKQYFLFDKIENLKVKIEWVKFVEISLITSKNIKEIIQYLKKVR